MNTILTLLAFSSLMLIPLSVDAFAENTYVVKIPTGAASPDAPYFWQSVKDGATNGVVEILIGDTIKWQNADTAAHTVTSGSVQDGPSDLFDSGLFPPGQQFSYTFDEIGNYPYYCIVHPWMDGIIMVTAGYSIIPNVGKQAGDGSTYFDVEYDFNRLISNPIIDEEQKSITFEIVGNPQSDNHALELRLPVNLIDGNFAMWVDGEKFTDFEQVNDGDLNILYIQLTADSKLLTIMGTNIVPEFGTMAMMILGISIVTLIILTQKQRIQIKL